MDRVGSQSSSQLFREVVAEMDLGKPPSDEEAARERFRLGWSSEEEREEVSEPVLTQLQLTPDNSNPVPTQYVPPHSCSPSFSLPLILVPPSSSFPTPYPSPLYPPRTMLRS